MAAMNNNEHTTRAVHSGKRDSNLNGLRNIAALAGGAVEGLVDQRGVLQGGKEADQAQGGCLGVMLQGGALAQARHAWL